MDVSSVGWAKERSDVPTGSQAERGQMTDDRSKTTDEETVL
jgi:hypothetical protein